MRITDLSKISKTTLIGVVSLATTVLTAIVALPPKVSVPVIALAVLRAVLGWLQKDAGEAK